MLNFLNLKSFSSNLFFCSSIQPLHTVLRDFYIMTLVRFGSREAFDKTPYNYMKCLKTRAFKLNKILYTFVGML